jgi:GT2 family glycosyltransferase
MTRPRVLLAVTVFNGEASVMRCLDSIARLDRSANDVDTVVLDDASPDAGFRDRLRARCRDTGVAYYSSPRNLGIPRNVNLGLLLAMDAAYDYVLISNSDVVYPTTAITTLVAAARQNERIGSVTAWSNNVSIYSLPNTDPDTHLDKYVVDWAAAVVGQEFGNEVVDIPAGISFSILLPVDVVSAVGLMDPVFGRGYCEELDWNLRAKAAGLRSVLAPGTFVYHEGGASTGPAGVIAGGHTTVPANEAIIDMRYPAFRDEVSAFVASGVMPAACRRAAGALLRQAARDNGYVVDAVLLDRPAPDPRLVHCKVAPEPDGALCITAAYRGFTLTSAVAAGRDPVVELRRLFGCDPERVRFFERSPLTAALAEGFGSATVVEGAVMYPERV